MPSWRDPASWVSRRLERLIQKECLVNHDSGRPLYESLHPTGRKPRTSDGSFAPSSRVTRAGSWSRNIEMRNRVPPGAALASKRSSRTPTSGSSRSSSSGRSTASRARARARRSTTCTNSRATALALYPTPSATLTRPVSSETRLSDYSRRWQTRRGFGYRIA